MEDQSAVDNMAANIERHRKLEAAKDGLANLVYERLSNSGFLSDATQSQLQNMRSLEAWPKSPHLQRNSCKAC